VHGNLTALEAVIGSLKLSAPHLVVHGGDLALMGPRSAELVDMIRELGWPGVVGNTDELLWRPEEHERQLEVAPALAPLLRLIFDVCAPDTRERLGDERMGWLRTLPPEFAHEGLAVVHAQPDDLWRAPSPDADDGELARTYGPLGTARVGYGHIHRPFIRAVESVTVANAGSVGLPWDGDARASYVIFEDGVAEIVRVEYDVETEVRALEASRHPDADRLAEMRRRGCFLPPRQAG
jgi:predicted phosphodiesterase